MQVSPHRLLRFITPDTARGSGISYICADFAAIGLYDKLRLVKTPRQHRPTATKHARENASRTRLDNLWPILMLLKATAIQRIPTEPPS